MRGIRTFIVDTVRMWLVIYGSLRLLRYTYSYMFSRPTGYEGLIVDTDLFSDVGDAGALLLACTHPKADLFSVNINGPSRYSSVALMNILGYYDKSSVYIGIDRQTKNIFYEDPTSEHNDYLFRLTKDWIDYAPPCKHTQTCPVMEPLDHYRGILARAKPKGITIVSLGYLEHLSDLVMSPKDKISRLSGRELIKEKVDKLVVMGGQYPRGEESNFLHNPTATENVVYNWPGKIVFAGSELGANVFSGGRLMREANDTDPIKAAYEEFNGYDNPSESWDPLAMLYAIEGPGDMFEHAGKSGHNYIFPNESNVWVENSRKYQHSYLKLKVSNEMAAARLDDLFLQGAAKHWKW